MAEFGGQLREWRKVRRMSQLDLAGEAGISTRHLSFLETGRSRPTEGMIARIGEALDLPVAERNALFASAGYTPRYGSAAGQDLEGLSEPVRQVVELILERHAPWPAACLNAAYDVIAGNAGFAQLASAFGIGPGANLLALVFEDGPVRDAIVNWNAFAPAFLKRARAEARYLGPRSTLAQRIEAIDPVPPGVDNGSSERPPPVIEFVLSLGGTETRWITTVTTIGSAQDAMLEGIFIEQYFPADATTTALVEAMAGARKPS
ncbi:MAG: helix-turn-helix domain-containing protein [Pseudomonadota bacterium]|nr:helix-turn-helix domain-containing protein [Pseudomonadota bacterium]